MGTEAAQFPEKEYIIETFLAVRYLKKINAKKNRERKQAKIINIVVSDPFFAHKYPFFLK
jgi:hypothetical protein